MAVQMAIAATANPQHQSTLNRGRLCQVSQARRETRVTKKSAVTLSSTSDDASDIVRITQDSASQMKANKKGTVSSSAERFRIAFTLGSQRHSLAHAQAVPACLQVTAIGLIILLTVDTDEMKRPLSTFTRHRRFPTY